MNDIALLVDDEHLPPELLLDPDIPINAEYFRKLAHVHRQINAQAAKMRPRQVELVRQMHQGYTLTKAAQIAKYTVPGASNFMRSAPGKRLLGLYRLATSLNEGPTSQHRMHMLFQIARDNQLKDPRTSLSAIEIMNKMSHTYQPDHSTAQVINIQINQEQLPRTPLDSADAPL